MSWAVYLVATKITRSGYILDFKYIIKTFEKLTVLFQLQQQQSSQPTQSNMFRKENDWNLSDNSNHSQIAISTQKGDFLVEQIKNGAAGEQSTYFLSPINSNKILSTLRRESDNGMELLGE